MTQDVQLNWLARYRTIVRQLPEVQEVILEVGSGAVGVGLIHHAPFVGCDVTFEHKPVANMLAVSGSALRLPFADSQFDCSIASDVLEHIPAPSRTAFMAELVRVSRRRIILGFPYGAPAEQADRWVARWLTWRKRPLPGWLIEHQALGVPKGDEVEHWLAQHPGLRWRVFDNENILMHTLFVIFDGTRAGGRLHSWLWRYCPALLYLIVDLAQWGQAYRRVYVVECA
jgi:hypothetical protein